MQSTMSLAFASRFVPLLLALQFAAFGWRINREISVADEGRKTWLPLPDILNMLSMLAVVGIDIILPLATDTFSRVSGLVLAVAYVLIAFHPISMAAHYRLFSRKGRTLYIEQGRDYPPITGQEAVCLFASVALAALAGWYVWR